MSWFRRENPPSEGDPFIAELLRVAHESLRYGVHASAVPFVINTGSPSVTGAFYHGEYFEEWRDAAWAARHEVSAKIYGDAVGWIDLGVWQ